MAFIRIREFLHFYKADGTQGEKETKVEGVGGYVLIPAGPKMLGVLTLTHEYPRQFIVHQRRIITGNDEARILGVRRWWISLFLFGLRERWSWVGQKALLTSGVAGADCRGNQGPIRCDLDRRQTGRGG
jgi:hypothetical protein